MDAWCSAMGSPLSKGAVYMHDREPITDMGCLKSTPTHVELVKLYVRCMQVANRLGREIRKSCGKHEQGEINHHFARSCTESNAFTTILNHTSQDNH